MVHGMASYRHKLETNTARANAASALSRDISLGWPKAARGARQRRQACAGDLKLFLERYFPAAFPLPWSCDHPRVISSLQCANLDGGLYALAMPRGSGKTAIAVQAAVWSVLFGHRRYVVLLGATEADAGRLLRTVKGELLDNELLARDFRAVTYPIRCLEDNARRCVGQLFRGERTGIVWSAKRVILPTMPNDCFDGGRNVSGSVLAVGSLEAAVRGHFHTLPTGEILRPDLVILDDVQTRESAASTEQTNRRLETIRGDVLGLAGPGKKITAVALLTVIQEGDLADTLLDRQRSPAWH